MTLKNSTYDALKWIGLIVLPAFATLYSTLGQIWGWGYTDQIVLTITAIDTFIGVVLGISAKSYTPDTDGVITIATDKGGAVLDNLELNDIPEDIADKSSITLEVKAKHLKSN